MSKNVQALKSGVWYTISNFLTRSIGLITTPIFARLLTKQDFGVYNNYTSWLSVLTIIVTMHIECTFISARFDFESDFDEYVFSTLCLSTFSALLWILITNSFPKFFSFYFKLDMKYINCMFLYLVFAPAIHMFQTRERYLFKYRITVLISLLLTVGTAIISVLLVVNLVDKLSGRIFGSASATIVIGIVLYIILAKKGKHVKVKYWKYALPICIPFIPHLLSMTLLNSMDKIMITDICGAEQTALYSLAYSCGAIITMLLTSLNSAFGPWLGEKLNNEKFSEIRKVSIVFISLFVYMAIGIMLITPEVLLFMGGESYMAAKYVMPPITCGVSCQFLYTMFVNVEQFKKKTVGMAMGSLSAALLNYILNTLMIPRFGYIASAYTTLIGYLWLLIIHMFLVKKIGYANVYDYKFIISVIIVLIFITMGMNVIYCLTTLRYMFVFIYIVFAIFVLSKYGKMMWARYKLIKNKS